MSLIQLVETYLTPNPYSRCGLAMERPRGLVFHYLGKVGQTAAQCMRYFEALKDQVPNEAGKVLRKASAHFIIDLDGAVLQLMPIPDPTTGRGGEIAFHAGPVADTRLPAIQRFGGWPNATLIGIEMCHTDASGRHTEATLASAREVGARLCEMYGLDPLEQVVRHYDITGKRCPLWFVDQVGEWLGFQAGIKHRMLEVSCVGARDGDC